MNKKAIGAIAVTSVVAGATGIYILKARERYKSLINELDRLRHTNTANKHNRIELIRYLWNTWRISYNTLYKIRDISDKDIIAITLLNYPYIRQLTMGEYIDYIAEREKEWHS